MITAGQGNTQRGYKAAPHRNNDDERPNTARARGVEGCQEGVEHLDVAAASKLAHGVVRK